MTYIKSYKELIVWQKSIELETQLIISKELKLTDPKNFIKCEQLLDEVCKMLNSMTIKISKLEARG